MEKLVLKKRLRAMTIRTQGLDELRQPQVQSLEVLRTPFGRFPMHVVAGGTANFADPCLVHILVKHGHFTGCVRKYRAPYLL